MFIDPKAQRKKKLEQLLHQEIAQVLHRVVELERAGKNIRITVMEVQASPDLRKINVFLSISLPEALEIVRHKSGKIRHALAERVDMRRVPELCFLPWDF